MEKVTITRNELYEMVWTESLTSLAKKYNISDNGLRKKCKKYDIPLPPMGYWVKLKYGKKVKRKPLPKSDKEAIVINLYTDEEVDVNDFHVPFDLRLKQIKREIENSQDLPLEFPSRLTNPDKLVKSTKEYLKNKKKDEFYLHSISNNDVLDISVSKASINRALLVMDYFIKLVRARGHDIKIEYGRTKVIMFTVDQDISMKEQYNTIKRDEYPYDKYVASGNLIFRARPSYHKTWQDSKTVPLEEKIISIVAWLETRARELKAHWDDNDRREKEEEERQRKKQEIIERKENEIRKFKDLLDEADRWHKARIIRHYVHYLEAHNIIAHEDQEDWIKWAIDKADWYDPTVCEEDAILGTYTRSQKFIQRQSNSNN